MEQILLVHQQNLYFQEMNHKKIGNFLQETGGDWMVLKRDPLSPINLLKIKLKVVMSPLGNFTA